ncbi:MAG: TonB-dependent receptor [Cyclobacteriaceae bacterium]
MRKLLLIVWLTSGSVLFAQDINSITATFNNTPAKDAFAAISEQSELGFYFQPEWIDTLSVTATFDNTPLESVLRAIVEGTTLSYVIYDQKVILTNNALIQKEPAIANSRVDNQSAGSTAKGFVFAREYQGQTDDQSDLENYVFEIGKRSELEIGGNSTIAGYVTDRETGDPITGALVYTQNPMKATTSDIDGFYSITLPNQKHQLIIQYVGMKTTQRNLVLFSNGRLDVGMDVDIIALQEITIESDRDVNIESTQMGVSRINIEEVKTVPIVLGENDIMKVATTKAGVQSVGEGAAGFNVRGGKADQNMILFNDAPVYNTSHFFGFFSVFNSDAIQSMELFKSGIPANFGGRLSSVFDIKSKTASKEEFKGSGGISPITSKLTLEIPIIKDRTSLLVGFRSTYSNWVLSNVDNARFRDNRVSFYDLITRVDHKINEKNSIVTSTYLSKDEFRLSSDTLFSFSNFSFTNFNSSVRWDHTISDRLSSRVSGIYSSYQYDLTYDQSPPNAFTQDFGLNEASLKAEFEYYPTEKQKINFGVSSKRYSINPGQKLALGSASIVSPQKVDRELGLESALHISDEIEFDKLKVSAGLRYVVFQSLGEQTVNLYEPGLPKNASTQIGSKEYSKGEIAQTYHAPEWRFSARYGLDKLSSIKIGMSRTRQYIHTMSNSASLSPTDTWRLSSQHLKPQTADEISIGYYRNFLRGTLEFSIENYYKRLQNLVDFKTGASFLLNQNIERAALQGPGKSYGIEVSLNKTGRLNGWINYAYARTFIQLDGNSQEETVNNGAFFPTNYDKPHTFNMVTNYKLTRRISFSVNTTYNTGRPVTVPVAAFTYEDFQNIHFSDRNKYRIPDYFRMDLGINLEGNHKIEKLSHSFWSLSIYNLTGRDNPFSVFFDVRNDVIQGSQLIVFGRPIPTLSYNFKF